MYVVQKPFVSADWIMRFNFVFMAVAQSLKFSTVLRLTQNNGGYFGVSICFVLMDKRKEKESDKERGEKCRLILSCIVWD